MTLALNPGDIVTHYFFDPHAGEVFQQHPDHAHLMVSDHGRVWSQKSRRFVGYVNRRSSEGAGRSARLRDRDEENYLRVTVGRKKVYLHLLVLETFVGPRPTGHDGDHINGDVQDNRLSNLRYLPSEENRSTR